MVKHFFSQSPIDMNTKKLQLTTKVILLSLVIFVLSCKSNTEKRKDPQESISEEVIEKDTFLDSSASDLPWEDSILESMLTLEEKLTVLLDTIRALKAEAFRSEYEKRNSAELLVEEMLVSFQSVDAVLINKVKNAAKELDKAMYTEVSFSNETAMEHYDAITAQFMDVVHTLAGSSTELEKHIRAKLLYNEIVQFDNDDFVIRKNYNKYVGEFNTLLSRHREAIEQLGPEYASLVPFATFYGEEVSIP